MQKNKKEKNIIKYIIEREKDEKGMKENQVVSMAAAYRTWLLSLWVVPV